MASPGDIPPSLEADFVALRKLRDDDYVLDDFVSKGLNEDQLDDPRTWESMGGKVIKVENGRVTKFNLDGCSEANDYGHGAATTQPNSQKQLEKQLVEMEARLVEKFEAANAGGCKCVIA